MNKTMHIGSSLDDFLQEENLLEQAQAQALKRVLAEQLTQTMQAQKLSKSAMARRMQTSRTQIERLLDPTNSRIQLDILAKAAEVLGRRLQISLI